MRSFIALLMGMFLLAACSQGGDEASSDGGSAASEEGDSTSLSIDTEDGGVSYENKDGGGDTSISIDTDEE